MTAPNLEERYSAAAFSILTDGLSHSYSAIQWAREQIAQAAHGSSTAFGAALASDWDERGYRPSRPRIRRGQGLPHWNGGRREKAVS